MRLSCDRSAVLVLSETVLVLDGTCWDVVDIRAKYRGFSFLEKVIACIDSNVFDYEYREAEYEKAGLLTTKIPEAIPLQHPIHHERTDRMPRRLAS